MVGVSNWGQFCCGQLVKVENQERGKLHSTAENEEALKTAI